MKLGMVSCARKEWRQSVTSNIRSEKTILPMVGSMKTVTGNIPSMKTVTVGMALR